MMSQFSKDGKYFAHLSTEGKLKIWNTATSTFEQEFSPNFHLTSPCTCLQFFYSQKKNGPSKKKMKRMSQEFSSDHIVLGTSSGLLLIYSISKGGLECEINSGTNQSITCLSCNEGGVFSGAEQSIICWNLTTRTVTSTWNAGTEKITAILNLPYENKLLTAARNIKLWNINSKQILKTFTGHSSEITILSVVNPIQNGNGYFISGSKGDRLLNCYNLNQDKDPVANFLMEDLANSVSVMDNEENIVSVLSITRSGVAHVYNHTLNGKCSKPIKPKTTVQIVSDTEQTGSLITPIQIIGGIFKDNMTISIAYGDYTFITFEHVILNEYEKVQCLIRKNSKSTSLLKETAKSKIRSTITENNVVYITPQSIASAIKRKENGHLEVPMEKRLENLSLNKINNLKVPKSDNVAQLLVQSLHSKDKDLLQSVLNNKEDSVVKNTVKRLPMHVIVPLIKQLTCLVQKKTLKCEVGIIWFRNLIEVHAGLLTSNPELSDLLGPVLGSIENRLSLYLPLCKLSGRLDLLVSQVTIDAIQENETDEAFLVFNDAALSDSDMEGIELPNHLDSDNEWAETEESSKDDNSEKQSSDIEM